MLFVSIRQIHWHSFIWSLMLLIALGAPASAAERGSGIALFQKHEFEEATAAFQADLQANPKDFEAIIYLGRIEFEENRLDQAARLFERAIALAPERAAGYHWLGRVAGVQARQLGAPRGMGAALRAKRALEKAVALAPDNLEARGDLATYYREAPGIVGGSNRAALAQVQEIARRDPYLGALSRGDLAVADKKFEEAERLYQSALSLQPTKTEAFFRLGILYERTQQFEKAFAAFDKMLALDPNDKRACFHIGKTADLSWLHLDRGEHALKTYLECQPSFTMPKLSWAHRRLGNIYLKGGHREAARQEYLAALKVSPDDPEAAAALKLLDDQHPPPR